MNVPRKILIPVDFSPSSLAALDYAVELAGRIGASWELLHVWEPPPVYGPDGFVGGAAAAYVALEDQSRREAGKRMEELVERLRLSGHTAIKARIERGVPPFVILDVVKSSNFDLVVMGTHGRTGISRLLAGSVAEKVVRLCPVPVLTVRHPDHAGEVSFAP